MSNREANFFMTKKMLTQSSIHAIINNGKLSFFCSVLTGTINFYNLSNLSIKTF